MAKTQLLTDWICIATAGYTVDGREISETELSEMADTYDPQVYTALIWLEHYRYFGNLGRVHEVKVEKVDGKTKLFARISPTAELMALNERGQKLFTSVEIMPNFQKTGKNYLYGLAVTDTPASTGTTALNFNARGVDENLRFGQSEPLHFTVQEHEEFRLFQKFKRFFSREEDPKADNTQPSLVDPDNKNNKEEHVSMTKEELKNAIQDGIAAAFAAQTKPAEPAPATTEKTVDTPTVSAEEFNALKADFENLQKQFSELSKEATPIPNGANPAITPDANTFTVNTAV
ncbi:hypothetical protein RO21_06085 [[Actinobacillus] muris]|uniref:Capsid protein n=1 Tax=Muribacter muris TaxID=67855 RepID=A0A0J5P5E1_9PAST|nr:GPO family capsid scaffolding protein [Muribacter muris]KMK51481.1 hypothetical protein RO21_06085 [[Actinobacillus] muris] [Muribacter muris]